MQRTAHLEKLPEHPGDSEDPQEFRGNRLGSRSGKQALTYSQNDW